LKSIEEFGKGLANSCAVRTLYVAPPPTCHRFILLSLLTILLYSICRTDT